MRRVAFLFDGFNLYHSLRQASLDLGGAGTRWLDLIGLSDSLLSAVGDGAQLAEVRFFTAPAGHAERLSPGARERQLVYLDALRTRGIEVELGHFKARRWVCTSCGAHQERFEEKETDVAIAVRLQELLWSRQCDAVVVVSADSDLAPAIRSVRRHFGERAAYCCFPYARSSDELRALVDRVLRLRKERYRAHQLPDPLVTSTGRLIHKPAGW